MAANLSGMFTQLNQAINANPMAQGGVGQGLLDMTAQQAGQGMSKLFSHQPKAGPQDPMNYMGAPAKALQGAEELASADLTTVEGLTKAAQTYQRMGKIKEAQSLLSRADAIKTKQQAQLTINGEAISEEAARKRRMAMDKQAISHSKRKGTSDLTAALESGALRAEEYFKHIMSQKPSEGQVLGDGAMLVKDGKVVVENPKDHKPTVTGTNGRKLSNHLQERLSTSTDNAANARAQYATLTGLADKMKTTRYTGGFATNAGTWINKQLGYRDQDDYLRTQFTKLRNSEAISQLPKGPASDKDIEIVMRGFPGDDADHKEIQEWAESTASVAEDVEKYEMFKSKYVSDNLSEVGMAEAWAEEADKIAKQKWIEFTPDAAVQDVMENPNMRAEFLAKYKWAPWEQQ